MVRIVSKPLEVDAPSERRRVGAEPIDVRIAFIPRDRDMIFRLRHRMLQGRVPADSRLIETNGRLIDPDDAGSVLLGAFDRHGEAVACIRMRPLDDEQGASRLPSALVGLGRRLSSTGARSSTSSDLVLAPEADRHVQVRMVAAMFSLARERSWAFDVCAATPEEVPLRRRLGYEETGVDVDGADEGSARRLMHLVFPDPRTPAPRRRFLGR